MRLRASEGEEMEEEKGSVGNPLIESRSGPVGPNTSIISLLIIDYCLSHSFAIILEKEGLFFT